MLQDDPSCQLLSVLRKYVQKVGLLSVQRTVCSKSTPLISTLQEGIMVLTRHWQQVLFIVVVFCGSDFLFLFALCVKQCVMCSILMFI